MWFVKKTNKSREKGASANINFVKKDFLGSLF